VCPQQLDHKDARIHCVILNKQATHPPHHRSSTPNRAPSYDQQMIATPKKHHPHQPPQRGRPCAVVFSGPNRVPTPPTSRTQPHPFPPHPHNRSKAVLRRAGRCQPWLASVSANEHPTTTNGRRGPLDRFHGQALLRKEVIQPHLPVRLPCYDFVPIASPTFDGSPPYGLGHRLRVLPTFVT
jgi:hypothetical protein